MSQRTTPNDPAFRPSRHEEEHQGSIWKHPYMIYVLLTGGLFAFLVGMAYLALKNNWIPTR